MYSERAIITCHELRLIFKLPLRQCQGFIDSLFGQMGLTIRCPDYTRLCRRLKALSLRYPRYRKPDKKEDDIAAIAIDSTGLKRFGRDEWHQEKHKVSAKRSWRKLHVAVDNKHIIQACELTDRFVSDDSAVAPLVDNIDLVVGQITADTAYDKNTVYTVCSKRFLQADIVIPPAVTAVSHKRNHPQRNRNLQEIKELGRIAWQKHRCYGQRNVSELAIQRYKRIIGNTLHAREFVRQRQEALIACGVLNKMTALGMPKSYRPA
ncbi:MAG: IS5 family transposase ISLlo3 [Legionellaceae bacterium]